MRCPTVEILAGDWKTSSAVFLMIVRAIESSCRRDDRIPRAGLALLHRIDVRRDVSMLPILVSICRTASFAAAWRGP